MFEAVANLSLQPSNTPTIDDPSPACRLCGGKTEGFLERDSYPIVRCSRCCFMFALLPENLVAQHQYVDDSYFSAEAAHGIADYDSLWTQLLSHLYLPRLNRMLEMGA